MVWPVVFSSTAAMALIGSVKLAATATWASAAQAADGPATAKIRAGMRRRRVRMGSPGQRWWVDGKEALFTNRIASLSNCQVYDDEATTRPLLPGACFDARP